MRVMVEVEFELDIPDTEDNLDLAVQRFFRKAAKTPLGYLMKKMHICNIRKIQPWEDSLSF